MELVVIFFAFIGTYKKMLFVLRLVPTLKQQFNDLINGKSQTRRGQISNLLFLQLDNQSQKFRIKLVKNR